MKRIFIAVNISEEARQRAADHIERLSVGIPNFAIRWVRPEKLHVTLRFIGDCGEDEQKKIVEIADDIIANVSPFTLRLAGSGIFPNEKNARTVWLGIQDEFRRMEVMKELFETGYKAKNLLGKRNIFKPHLTIARIKDIWRCREMVAKHLQQDFEPVEFIVFEIVIYESILASSGSVYSVLSRHKLNG